MEYKQNSNMNRLPGAYLTNTLSALQFAINYAIHIEFALLKYTLQHFQRICI